MNIEQFASLNGNCLKVSREQASSFAKGVAGDFNPIHDADAKKFCVPGDLLFAIVLHRYGVCDHMRFEFEGMVNDTTELLLPESAQAHFGIVDAASKQYMSVSMEGRGCPASPWVDDLAKNYVQFSGKAFPHILVDLMRNEGVMINPQRPLVIYRDMVIVLDEFETGPIHLELTQAELNVDGKKGVVSLAFHITSEGREIGHGTKNMLLSGLREYDQAQMDVVIENYNQSKLRFQTANK